MADGHAGMNFSARAALSGEDPVSHVTELAKEACRAGGI
jgi:hypothetical protein